MTYSNRMLTIFTPTYNRKNTLKKGYEALLKQKNKDFIWLIIDDGSTDDTQSVVNEWMKRENGFEIQYVYKENGGLHTGYNKALELIKTELCVCIDSDDYIADNGVELILDFWKHNKAAGIAGFIARDAHPNGCVIGGVFPKVEKLHVIELGDKYGFIGDTKMVFRSDLLKKVSPQPTYNNEKNFNPIYMIILLDYNYSFKLLDKVLCYVEYDALGMSRNIFRQFYNSPNSFAALRLAYINSPYISLKGKLRNYIHLGSSILLSKNIKWAIKAPHRYLLFLLLPFSVLLTLFVILKK